MEKPVNERFKLLINTLGLGKLEFAAGPTGPQGAKGDTGNTGQQGPIGPQGNANVSDTTINLASGNWFLSGSVYYTDISLPTITSSIVSSGSVEVFMRSTSSTGVWLNMPWIETISASLFSIYNYNYSLGYVRIFKQDSDLTAPSNPGVRTFKIIVIASQQKQANPNVNWKDYSQVKKALNLKD